MINFLSFQKFKTLEISELNYLNTVGGDYFLLGKLKHGFFNAPTSAGKPMVCIFKLSRCFYFTVIYFEQKDYYTKEFFKKNLEEHA